jgi:PAS domain S-box-containing protein
VSAEPEPPPAERALLPPGPVDLGLLEAVLRQAPIPFAFHDGELRYRHVNEALGALNGRTPAEHLGHRPSEILDPDLAAHLEGALEQVLRSGEPLRTERVYNSGRLRGRSFVSSWYPAADADGTLRGVGVFFQEITALQRSESALDASRGRTLRLLEATTRLAPALRVEEVLTIMADIGREALGADYTGVGLLDEGGTLRLPAPLGWGPLRPWVEIVATESTLVARVLRDGTPAYVADPGAYLDLVPDVRTVDLLDEISERAWAVLPLRTTGDTFGVLRLAFRTERVLQPGERLFLEALAGQCALAVERARLYEREHEAVVMLQRSLLPAVLPRMRGLDVACRYLPAQAGSAIGGDWYDVFALPDGRVGFVVGDVMGNGLMAAACMGRVRAARRAFAFGDADPGAVLTGLDRLFEATETEESLTTLLYAVIDVPRGVVDMGSAGHLPLLVVRADGRVQTIAPEPAGTPLGWAEHRMTGPALRLAPGDALVAFSDGLVENRLRSVDAGLARVVAAVEQARGFAPEDMCDHLVTCLLDGQRREDDVTLLIVRLGAGDL